MDTQTRTMPGYPDTTVTGDRQLLDAIFKNTEETRPGPPFFDDTLNYLQSQFDKVNSERGTTINKKFKLEDQIIALEKELETVRGLLVEEYRQRRPFNPETGEAIQAPFGDESGGE